MGLRILIFDDRIREQTGPGSLPTFGCRSIHLETIARPVEGPCEIHCEIGIELKISSS